MNRATVVFTGIVTSTLAFSRGII